MELMADSKMMLATAVVSGSLGHSRSPIISDQFITFWVEVLQKRIYPKAIRIEHACGLKQWVKSWAVRVVRVGGHRRNGLCFSCEIRPPEPATRRRA
jgi:hypothetical protein